MQNSEELNIVTNKRATNDSYAKKTGVDYSKVGNKNNSKKMDESLGDFEIDEETTPKLPGKFSSSNPSEETHTLDSS